MSDGPEERSAPSGAARAVLAICGFVFVVVGLLVIVSPWVVRARDTRVAESGGHAAGIITAVSPPLDQGGDGEHTVSYTFEGRPGEVVQATRAVSEERWRAATVGGAITIDFDPEHPSDNFPTGSGQTSLGVPAFLSVLGVVFAAFGLVVLVGAARSGRR